MNLNIPFDTTSLFVNNAEWKHFPAQNLINDKNDRLTDVLSKFDKVSGIYIFWWSGSLEELKRMNRRILIQGKKENDSFRWLPIEWQTEWLVPERFDEIEHFALYVGKSTTLRSRIRQHFHFSMTQEAWKACLSKPKNKDGKSKLQALKGMRKHHNSGHAISYNPTTSCQFRAGMSLLCRDIVGDDDFWNIIKNNITLSVLVYNDDKKYNFVAERFYLEDFLIGALRPWFNLDSER